MNQTVYIVDAVRTPVTKAPKGAFRHTRPEMLLSHTINGIIERQPNLPVSLIEDVMVGCAMPEAEQGMNVARIALLLAGLPNTIPGMTINRFCCSGLQTIALAANQISAGQADIILAGGVESMSMVPMGGNKFTIAPEVFDDANVGIAYGMGLTAEKVAKDWQISAEDQLAFALRSHQRAIAAEEAAFFNDEILPIEVTQRGFDGYQQVLTTKSMIIDKDEGPRGDTSIEKMARLKSPFALGGSVTAATSSQMSDGAGMTLVVSESALNKYNLTPIAEFKSYAVAGVPPEIMGIGPVKAIPLALEKANLSLEDINWIELNEAFAAQSLACIKDLQLDIEKVNPYGGAIALGHPLGATGAIRTATLLHGLQRTKQNYGMVTMCIGTGMGACGIFKRV